MVYPAIKLHKLYSLNLYEGLDVIFEDLDMLNITALEEIVKTKSLGNIQMVKNSLTINTTTKIITVVGNKINESTYIINRQSKGDVTIMPYKCSDEVVLTAIEYLYHMYNSLVKGA
jgi:hypothetical protein